MIEYRYCPSCRIRFRVPPPSAHDYASPWTVDPNAWRWIENAARTFDEIAYENGHPASFTASEFVAWLRPDIVLREDAA